VGLQSLARQHRRERARRAAADRPQLCYGQSLAVDGLYGPKTEAAVKYVQSNDLLPPPSEQDGGHGPITIRAGFVYQASGGITGKALLQVAIPARGGEHAKFAEQAAGNTEPT
jgi:peptidoglycan hydrolase-like protein with peptidoglycan-binding domain